MNTFNEYAIVRGKIINWRDFTSSNTWAVAPELSKIPHNCRSIYYVINMENEVVQETLYLTTYDERFKPEFKDLSLAWVSEHFEVEKSDILQVETPEEVIIQPGGEIFFLLNQSETVVGVVATVIHRGICELAKMTIRKEYTGKGLSSILMKESIDWSRERNYPFIELLSNVKLQNAINIYKKWGFETTHLGPHADYNRCNIIMRLTL